MGDSLFYSSQDQKSSGQTGAPAEGLTDKGSPILKSLTCLAASSLYGFSSMSGSLAVLCSSSNLPADVLLQSRTTLGEEQHGWRPCGLGPLVFKFRTGQFCRLTSLLEETSEYSSLRPCRLLLLHADEEARKTGILTAEGIRRRSTPGPGLQTRMKFLRGRRFWLETSWTPATTTGSWSKLVHAICLNREGPTTRKGACPLKAGNGTVNACLGAYSSWV